MRFHANSAPSSGALELTVGCVRFSNCEFDANAASHGRAPDVHSTMGAGTCGSGAGGSSADAGDDAGDAVVSYGDFDAAKAGPALGAAAASSGGVGRAVVETSGRHVLDCYTCAIAPPPYVHYGDADDAAARTDDGRAPPATGDDDGRAPDRRSNSTAAPAASPLASVAIGVALGQ